MIFTIEDIAGICHEANRQLCFAQGDISQVKWSHAPRWQRNSAMNGVCFKIDNPSAPQSASHDNWMKVKVEDGWVYGEKKDEVKKTHPCLVPFDQLPPAQQAKDHLFCAIVESLLQFAACGK